MIGGSYQLAKIYTNHILSVQMSRFIKIGDAAKLLGVSPQTMRRWERIGKCLPERAAPGETRYYSVDKLLGLKNVESDVTIAYALVSSHDQKEDLKRQASLLSTYCTAHGWNHEVIQDLGSGMNYHKKGLRKLLDHILKKNISRLVLTHKDRLLRFGAELIFALCEARGIEIVILNQGEDTSFEEELTKDVLEIITVFSARL